MFMRRLRSCSYGVAGAVLALAGAGCGSGPAGAPVRLDAGPAAAALVDPVHVSVSGLPPSGLVTVQARAVDREGQPWESAAVFRASAAGTLNLATAIPVSGSYHAADAGGLLWSLHPAPGTSQATGFDISAAGFTVRLEVLTGGHVRAAAALQRQAPVTASVQTVRRDGFAGTLFTSPAIRPGRSRRPGVTRRGRFKFADSEPTIYVFVCCSPLRRLSGAEISLKFRDTLPPCRLGRPARG